MALPLFKRTAGLLPGVIALALLLGVSTAARGQERQVISLRVDTTDYARKLMHAEMNIPVKPGDLTLVGPGSIANVAWMAFSANGQTLAWARDPVDMAAFHLQIPAGVQTLHAAVDSVFPARQGGRDATPFLFFVRWNGYVLRPQGIPTDDLAYGDVPGPVLAARETAISEWKLVSRSGCCSARMAASSMSCGISPTWKAGLGPGMKVLSVNGRIWSDQNLRDAIAADRAASDPIEVVVQNQSAVFKTAIQDHKGLRYPRLERNSSPDTLSELFKPCECADALISDESGRAVSVPRTS